MKMILFGILCYFTQPRVVPTTIKLLKQIGIHKTMVDESQKIIRCKHNNFSLKLAKVVQS